MKKMLKKVLAIFMTAVIAVGAFGVTAFAADDNVLKNGKAFTGEISDEGSIEKTFVANSGGILEISYSINKGQSTITVSEDGIDDLKIQSVSLSDGCKVIEGGKGKTYLKGEWNKSISKFTAKVTYKVSKGTYKIKLKNNSWWSGTYTIKATLKSSGSKETNGKPEYFTATMKKGSTLQLGAVVTEEGGNYEYSSSKPSVATVSSSGKVTAKAKGSTIITLKYGTGSIKMKIIVTN